MTEYIKDEISIRAQRKEICPGCSKMRQEVKTFSRIMSSKDLAKIIGDLLNETTNWKASPVNCYECRNQMLGIKEENHDE